MIIFKLTYIILVSILYFLTHVSINALTSLLTPTKFRVILRYPPKKEGGTEEVRYPLVGNLLYQVIFFFTFDSSIFTLCSSNFTLCSSNITCDSSFLTFGGSLNFFSHLTVLSSHCALPIPHVTVLFSHLVVPFFFLFFSPHI